MSDLTLKSTFNAVTIGGLVDPQAFAQLMVGLFAGEDVREALGIAVDATKDLEADRGRSANEQAQARLDDALDTLAREIACKDTAVTLETDEARRLRDRLIAARLGYGRADNWLSNRRTAA